MLVLLSQLQNTEESPYVSAQTAYALFTGDSIGARYNFGSNKIMKIHKYLLLQIAT